VAFAIQWLVASVDLPLRSRQLWATVAALLTMSCAVWLALHVNAYIARYVRERFRNASLVEIGSLVRLGHRIADVLVVVAGGLVALKYFGLDPTAALAGLGIGGIAVALAAQKTLENVIGGLSLIFDKAVRVGDFLKLDNVYGTVDSIGLRSTRIRTLDRTILSVPNGQIANVNVETLSVRDMCWFHHTLGLRYETTSAQIKTVIEGIRERMTAHPLVDRDSVRARLISFGKSSLDIEIFAYVMTGDWPRFLEVQEQLLVGIMEIVERAGTAIAFPTQTLHVAGDRTRRSLTAVSNLSVSRDVNVAGPAARAPERPTAGA
jgi:MscS family membrane protein